VNDASYAPIIQFVQNIFFGFLVMWSGFSRISGFGILHGIFEDSCWIFLRMFRDFQEVF